MVRETYRAVPESVAPLRAMVADFAARAGLPSSGVERVKLAVSEAATNAVVHAFSIHDGLHARAMGLWATTT